ncbi:DUF6468 domain-containing protein [Sphingomonas oligoaromativorans]|uniref:DUF6468 domain-containing protein n=1 Tax=Sphingomonas oligoaromativorans TaxID=575322 RepID=UPI0014232B48|nr:DUF6468 domain-containing protein [Sphingomonas oligoaromativorans]NIJ34729.1 hypothetical protein [Sphingomonas oligoaromativorans]
MTFASLTNIVVACLCLGVILQSVRMIRNIRLIQTGDLGDTIKSLDRATAQARAVLAELKDVLITDGAANARIIATGETLRDELSVMVGIGNAVADRIMEAASPGDQHNKADAVTPKPSPKRSRRRRAAPRADTAVEGAPAHASLQ